MPYDLLLSNKTCGQSFQSSWASVCWQEVMRPLHQLLFFSFYLLTCLYLDPHIFLALLARTSFAFSIKLPLSRSMCLLTFFLFSPCLMGEGSEQSVWVFGY